MLFKSISHHFDFVNCPRDAQMGCIVSHVLNISGRQKESMFSIHVENYTFTLFNHPLSNGSKRTGKVVSDIAL